MTEFVEQSFFIMKFLAVCSFWLILAMIMGCRLFDTDYESFKRKQDRKKMKALNKKMRLEARNKSKATV